MKATLALILAFGVGMAGIVSAETAVDTSVETNMNARAKALGAPAVRMEIKEEARGRIQVAASTTRNIRAEMRAEIRAASEARIESLARARFTRMALRYEATIVRLDDITARVDSRIEKARAAGADTSAAEAASASAKASISHAATLFDSLKVSAVNADNDTNPESESYRARLAEMRTTVKNMEKDLVNAKTSLLKAVAGLKASATASGTVEAGSGVDAGAAE